MKFLIDLPWGAVIFLCLTLGLAPFAPPHIYEKLRMLVRGELVGVRGTLVRGLTLIKALPQ